MFGRGLLYVSAAAAQMVSSAVVSPVLAHGMGDPAEFGKLASAIALHQLLVVVAAAGLDQAVVLQRAEDGHERNAGAAAGAGIVLATAVTLLLAVTARWWAGPMGFEEPSALLTATIVWTVPAVAVMVLLGLLLGGDRLRPFAVISLVAALGGQLLGLVLLFGLRPLAASYLWGVVAADALAAAIALVLTRRAWFRMPRPVVVRRSLALGLPLLLGSLSTFVLNAGDRIVIQRVAGAAEVGRYQVAYTLGGVVVQLVVMLGSSWLPRFAEVREEAQRWRLIGHSRDGLYLLLAPVVLGLTLAAPVLLRIFAPESFGRETLLVVVLMVLVSAYPVAASGASGRMLLTARRARPIGVIALVAAVVNIGLNFLLVPLAGIAGAAAATVLALMVQAVLQRLAVVTGGHGSPWPRSSIVLLVLSTAVVLVAWLSTFLPQSALFNGARFALGLVCLPWLWFYWRRVVRSGSAAPPPRGAVVDASRARHRSVRPSRRSLRRDPSRRDPC
ncbi:oligosaccharide flippase family protein [Kineococcus sp. T13]|uniref:lipopolysaccharide biosynthesis protein n=1 Tax=Kineococcus vitellinus TaxID=2696565 RepID=UPI001413337E|nr:lipopolysaccharide biosynthesis protein [Kineococcus vitellinus]NAZ74084.1 oligosaccharide flippase family protein [Kineococcus vitellinus]